MKQVVSLLMMISCVCISSACGKKDGVGLGDDTVAKAESPLGAEPKAYAEHTKHFDLWEHAHLAEVDHQGLYIEFGTPARHKYTYGDWRSGWGKEGATSVDRFSYAVGDSSRVYFRSDKSEPLTLRFRLKPVGTAVVTPYLNNQPLSAVRIGGEFKDYDVAVPAERVNAGENRLMLRFGGTTMVDGEARAAAVASLRVIRGAAPTGPFAAPHYAELRTELPVGGVQRRALAVRSPTTLAFYLDIPKDGKLGFGVGISGQQPPAGKGAKASVVVTPEGGAPKELFKVDLASKWSDQVLDLNAFAGRIAKVELKIDGDVGTGRAAWSTPALLLPKKPLAKQEKIAKNVIVVLIDTLRARSLKSFNAQTRVKTPVIDTIASEGAVLEATQAPENWTKPSTASVLTGLYPATHGAKTDAAVLPKGATLLSESLKEAGFRTSSFIANGYVSDKFGFNQGWDYYTNYIREKKSTDAENVFKDAGDWIEKNKDKRFFAYVHTIDPHVPYDPPDEFLNMYKKGEYSGQISPRKTADQLGEAKHAPPKITFNDADKQYLKDLYDGEVSYHDHYLGLFVARLKKLGLYDDTVFVITADHGEEFDEHGSWGHGHTVYQDLLWIPYVVRFPGVVPAGTRIKQATSSMTIFPTVLEAAGVALPNTLEEKSVLSWLRGGPAPAVPVAFSDFLDDRRVIRAGRWKLILRGLNETFFDLQSDPTEQKELERAKYPVAVRYVTSVLGQFLGARDRRSWLKGEQGQGTKLEKENANIDETLREQLKAIGYAGDEPVKDAKDGKDAKKGAH
jgi:arylsulfatase A-like enzyme